MGGSVARSDRDSQLKLVVLPWREEGRECAFVRFETGAGERRVRWTGGISATGGTSALRLRAHVVCQKHSSAVPLPQGFQKLDQFGIYSLSAGFVRRWIVRRIVDVPLRQSLAPLCSSSLDCFDNHPAESHRFGTVHLPTAASTCMMDSAKCGHCCSETPSCH